MQTRTSQDPLNRYLARLGLAVLPRGGGDGDAIRMGILHIMREHGIREGHRPVSHPFPRIGCSTRTPVLYSLIPKPGGDPATQMRAYEFLRNFFAPSLGRKAEDLRQGILYSATEL